MINNLFIFIASLALVIRGATIATKYAALLASNFRLSRYTVGFIIVAVISILPETFISITSALNGIPSFGLGMLFGSNIADLTLIFAILVFFAGRSLKVESKIMQNDKVYPFILLLPLILGWNGHFSRIEGLTLILSGIIFYYLALKEGSKGPYIESFSKDKAKNFAILLFSMILIIIGSHFTVTSATGLASAWGVSPILIGMLIVSLGTTMPELFFSMQSVKKHNDSLAIGDILGTVLADATIVVGILAAISPFSFPVKIIYITGVFMVLSSFLLFYFMRSGRTLTKKEACILLFFWIIFVLVEFAANS